MAPNAKTCFTALQGTRRDAMAVGVGMAPGGSNSLDSRFRGNDETPNHRVRA